MTSDTIHQKILINHPENIPSRHFSRRHAGAAVKGLTARLGDKDAFVGFSAQHNSEGRVEFLALATVEEVLLISADKPSELLTNDKPFEDLLRGDSFTLVGFDMGRLVSRIANDLNLRVRGIDLSTAFRANTWDPPLPSDVVKSRLFQGANPALIDGMWIDEQGPRELGLRAWLAACVAENNPSALNSAVRLDTNFLSPQEITFLAELVRQTHVLDRAKPKERSGEFTNFHLGLDGTLILRNARYKTRVRRGNQTVIMTNEKGQEFFGEARGSKGRTTNIEFTGKVLSGNLEKVRVFGCPSLTNTEKAQNELVLRVLEGLESLRTSFFIRMLWFPTKKTRALIMPDTVTPAVTYFEGLNTSQQTVASKMISDCHLVIAHGPPGTGKTTTIAAAVSDWEYGKLPTWIVAHSNVAVKNMAETLFKKGIDFKILVSKEFHFEWHVTEFFCFQHPLIAFHARHEHIYEKIDERVLVSDAFLAVKDHVALSRLLGGSCIMLSTLGMLSNPTLDRIGMFSVVPVGRLVVDEASQIKIEDFLHILHRFRKSLEKLCFFGDPNQLPPYGKDQVPKMRTIFDLPHLAETACFLDTQYRMPVPLGDFISKYIYGGRLKSKHNIYDTSCISFVDTINGSEIKSGFSWTNQEEIRAVVNIVKTYYRYRNFCVITPYDAQRAAIEKQLKNENLPWEHVFNVDSFQGNETDFVLVSVVRSETSPGFLSSQNRMNVLLTRCKRGLVIVTSRSFIETGGRGTLLGDLQRQWMQKRGNSAWVDWRTISEGTADLPGAPGPNRNRRGVLFQHGTGSLATVGRVTAPPIQRTFDVRSLFPRRPMAGFCPEAIQPPVSMSPFGSLSIPSSLLFTNSLFSGTPSQMASVWSDWDHLTPSPPMFTKTSGSFSSASSFPLTPRSEFPATPSSQVWSRSDHDQWTSSHIMKTASYHDDEFPELPTTASLVTSLHKHSLRHKGVYQSKGAKEHIPQAPSIHGPAVRRLQISEQQIARVRTERPSSKTTRNEKQPHIFSSKQRK
ncbi:hypothetical protein E4T56_gene5962 [Termitomyces sp. T112]|nr:hypothetical protein E4T56_gene5962 [Termitomyces sp. T112]